MPTKICIKCNTTSNIPASVNTCADCTQKDIDDFRRKDEETQGF